MWFFVPAIVLVVLVALWVRRTHVYRHLRSGRGANPGHMGYAAGRYGVVPENPGPRDPRPDGN
jgi:hypothetical protein